MNSLPTNNRWKRDPDAPKPRRQNSFTSRSSRGRSERGGYGRSERGGYGRSERGGYGRSGRGRQPRAMFRRPDKPAPPRAPDISSMEAFPSLGGARPVKKTTLNFKEKAQGEFNLPKHEVKLPKRMERVQKKEEEVEIDYNDVAAHEDKCELSDAEEYNSSDEAPKRNTMVSLKKKKTVRAPVLN